MWRHLLASFLLVSFLIQTFSTNLLVANFYANQKYIAANLCLNKSKPEMKCCGKCQLIKKLSEEESKNKQYPGRKSEGKEEVISSVSFFSTIVLQCEIIKRLYPFYQENLFSPYSYTFFHPPRMV
ncbi:MAG: hypothetical protein ABJA71_14765 [Ginsengibacter sp.]